MKIGKRLVYACCAVLMILETTELSIRLFFPGIAAKAATMQFANPHRDQPESFVRDPLLFWRLKPDNAAWEVNADGYRGPRRAKDKPAGTIRVCCLGDSCTFGLGAQPLTYAETYPAILEKLLAARLRRPVEVLNFGCPGYTSWQGLRQLETVVPAYRPDIVTAYFGTNDGYEAIGYPDAEQRPLDQTPGGLIAGLQAILWHSAGYTLLTRGVTWAKRATAETGLPRVSFEAFRVNAAAMRSLARERGFRLYFIPTYYIEKNGVLTREEISVVEPLIDPREAFFGRGYSPSALFSPPPDRVHPTSLGHQLIAETLADRLANDFNNASLQDKAAD